MPAKTLKTLVKDESGMSVVETIIITGLLGAAAVVAWSTYRSGASNAASIVSQKAVSIVSNGGSW